MTTLDRDDIVEAMARAICKKNYEYSDLPESKIASIVETDWRSDIPLARAALDAALPLIGEMLVKAVLHTIEGHQPDASFDDSASGVLERKSLLYNVGNEVAECIHTLCAGGKK